MSPVPRFSAASFRSLAVAVVTIVAALAGAALVAYGLLYDPRGVGWTWSFGRVELRRLPHWHALAVLAVVAPVVLRLALIRSRAVVFLLASFVVGVTLHVALLTSEKNSLRKLEERVLVVGHAEFVRIARGPLPDHLIRDYETLVRSQRWVFPRSKPPGALLIYRAIVATSETPLGQAAAAAVYLAERMTAQPGTAASPIARVTATVVLLLTLLTFATIWPLYFLTRALCEDEGTARTAVALWISCPLVALVSIHLDNAVYPLLSTAVLLLMARSLTPGWAALFAALAGLVMSAALFVTFSVLPIVPLAAVVPLCVAAPYKNRIGSVALFGATIAGCYFALLAIFGLDLRVRFADAQSFHAGWWSGGGHDWRIGNAIQFAVWLGIPLSLLFIGQVIRSAIARREPGAPSVWWNASVAAVLLALVLSGTAKSEVMRLWAFYVPAVAIVAAAWARPLDLSARHWFMPIVVTIQIASAIVLHAFRSP